MAEDLRSQQTLDDRDNLKLLTDAFKAYPEGGLSVVDVSLEGIAACNYTVSRAVKVMKILKPLTKNEHLIKLFHYANDVSNISSILPMTLETNFKFCKWLTSPVAKKKIAALQNADRLRRRGSDVVTPEEAAMIALLESAQADRTTEYSKARARYDIDVAKYKKKIAKRTRQLEEDLDKVQASYPGLQLIERPDEHSVMASAWHRYVDFCTSNNFEVPQKNDGNLARAYKQFERELTLEIKNTACQKPEVRDYLLQYCKEKVKGFVPNSKTKELKLIGDTMHARLETYFLRIPLERRGRLLDQIPVGRLTRKGKMTPNIPLSQIFSTPALGMTAVHGTKPTPPIQRNLEMTLLPMNLLKTNLRVQLLTEHVRGGVRQISIARSKWEAGVRRIIGGGEMRGWEKDSALYRGGGNLHDAIRLLATGRQDPPGSFLFEHFSLETAREILLLPCNLEVPDGPKAVRMKNFNEDATAGPVLRALRCKSKYGLKEGLERIAWDLYDRVGDGKLRRWQLPPLLARIGFRSKLVEQESAIKKIFSGQPIGRAVMMLDAMEQPFSSPLYNALCDVVSKLNRVPESGWRNMVVRASSDWSRFWGDIRNSCAIVELDWSKFDRERPKEDIEFVINIFVSCFLPKNRRERRLLSAYKYMMRKALIDKVIMLDDGCAFTYDGMIPSGSLWTGLLGTALNILYINAAVRRLGIPSDEFVPYCAGDDNLTVFKYPQRATRLGKIRGMLNEMFRAGIDPEDFIIHYPPFHVTKVQAKFPAGFDFTHGTSKFLDQCQWIPLKGNIHVDHSEGLSHRWNYVFKGKPKFLANYFMEDGRSIRPAHDNLEKLLYPENVQQKIEDYEAAVLSMAVDNPWNSHNINHLMQRFCIIQQIKRQAVHPLTAGDVLFCAKFQSISENMWMFPTVGAWRRQLLNVRMEDIEELKPTVEAFSEFVRGVTSLYSRASTGGLDSWQFMEILRGERDAGSGQYGSDIEAWCAFLNRNGLTRSLRPAKRYRKEKQTYQSAEAGDKILVSLAAIYATSDYDLREDRDLGFIIRISNELRKQLL
ncbi:fusion protein [Zostera marina amalgavirus 1]|uniref:Fusion protein n=1 Tax=Zostera marina amalgavirus 1 TaxID=1985202 RepID=A0A1W6R5E2_9VIRU|nr:fusion protein [Zostera marina amalgavirus 1]ARO49645.1 fusion protein [Zostera marina amalgavirus 1]